MPRILMLLGTVLLAVTAAGRAQAGAWLAPEGGQKIWTSTAGMRGDARIFETSAYWEEPLGDTYSFVAAPWIEQADDLPTGWRGEAVIGLKRALFRDGPNALAVQGGALWRSDGECQSGGAELRGLVGRSLGDDSFINLEVAGRALSGGCGGVRIDLAAGWRPNDNWLAMGQVFYDDPQEGEQSLKLQFSVTRFDAGGRGVQLGLRTRLDGDAQETALVFGFWPRSGD